MLSGIALTQSLFSGMMQDVVNEALAEVPVGAQVPAESELITTKFKEKLDPAKGSTCKSNVVTPLTTTLTLVSLCITPVGLIGINTLPVNAQSNVNVTVVDPQFNTDGLGVTVRPNNVCENMMSKKSSPNFFI